MNTNEDHPGGWIRALPPVRRDPTASIGSLEVRAYKGRPFYEARWRDLNRTERRKRLGRAWVELDAEGNWVPKRGRVRKGYLDERSAYPLMAEVIEEHPGPPDGGSSGKCRGVSASAQLGRSRSWPAIPPCGT